MQTDSSSEMPRDATRLHQDLIDSIKAAGHIISPQVEAAFRAVPRHLFLPDVPLEEVYRDQAIMTKQINGELVSSSSQPTMMAIMLEQLQLQMGQRVLEIGAGTGYNAALLAHIVGESGQVVTIDIDTDIVEQAQEHLAFSGYTKVQVLCADGALGYPPAALYDRIVLTVNASDIAPAWREQLTPDGRLLLPLALRGPQVSVVFEQVGDHLESRSLRACGFVGLRGSMAESKLSFPLKVQNDGTLSIRLAEMQNLDADRLFQTLQTPYQESTLSLYITRTEMSYSLSLWLALHQSHFCEVYAYGQFAEQELLPPLFMYAGKTKMRSTFGLLNDTTLCLLTWDENALQALPQANEQSKLSFALRTYGPDSELTETLSQLILAWDKQGRPSEQNLHVQAYVHPSHSIESKSLPDDEMSLAITRQHTRFICSWN